MYEHEREEYLDRVVSLHPARLEAIKKLLQDLFARIERLEENSVLLGDCADLADDNDENSL